MSARRRLLRSRTSKIRRTKELDYKRAIKEQEIKDAEKMFKAHAKEILESARRAQEEHPTIVIYDVLTDEKRQNILAKARQLGFINTHIRHLHELHSPTNEMDVQPGISCDVHGHSID